MRKHKISLTKVQAAFNDAIRRRDGRCMVKDFHNCYGQLECSHFFTVGSSPALRFYPLNAWTQCHRHHLKHHNEWKADDDWSYKSYLKFYYENDLEWMETHRNNYIKYTDELKAEIIKLCNADKLDELKELIEGELK